MPSSEHSVKRSRQAVITATGVNACGTPSGVSRADFGTFPFARPATQLQGSQKPPLFGAFLAHQTYAVTIDLPEVLHTRWLHMTA